MKILSASLCAYRLPLARTLILRNQPHEFREGLVLRVSDDKGRFGLGEVAPLPGHSAESLAEARQQLIEAMQRLPGLELPTRFDQICRVLDTTLGPLGASVRCGLEAASAHLVAESLGRAVRFVETAQAPSSVPLNGLLTGDTDAMLSRVSALVNGGYQSIKLKLGQRTLEEDIALTYRVFARLAGPVTLRLDANRAWTFEQAMAFGKSIETLKVEYIEEPLQQPSRIPELAVQWPLPIALDESLVAPPSGAVQQFEKLAAVVIKPTLVGGFSRSFALAQWARDLGLAVVISSSFESSLGLAFLGHFASQVAPGTPCGLDTADWLQENLLEQPFPIEGGNIRLDPYRTVPSRVREELLKEVFRV